MEGVFYQAVENQEKVGKFSALLFYLHELRDLPGNLIREHRRALKLEKATMTIKSEIFGNHSMIKINKPGSWSAAMLAGLPHFLMGLLLGVGKILSVNIYPVSQTAIVSAVICLALVVLVTLGIAWKKGWPLWSASWYLYGTWVVMIVLGLGIEKLNLDESWRYNNALFFGWILICIFGYTIILFKSRLHGLISVAFLFPLLGVMFLEFIPNPIEGWLAIGLGTLTALTIAAIVRSGEFRFGLWAVFCVNLIAGLSLAYIGEYQIKELPSWIPAHVPKFGNFLELLVFYSVFSSGVVALPFMLRGLWHFTRRRIFP